MKRKTKKRLKKALVGVTLVAAVLPIFSGFFPSTQSSGQQVDPKLLQAYLESQIQEEDEMPVLPNIEGNYTVVEVKDGASFSVMWGDYEETVELIGVEPADGAKKLLEELVADGLVSLEFDTEDKDEDGNLQVYAYAADSTFINQKLIVEGVARMKDETENVLYRDELRSAQNKAKEDKAGIWAQEAKNDR